MNATTTRILPIGLTALLALNSPLIAITGSWQFTGYRFEGSKTTPQLDRSDGTVTITEASPGTYTIQFQLTGATRSLTIPLTKTGNDYLAEVDDLAMAPYDVKRRLLIRDHGRDTLTINWVDAGYEQVSPYGGFPDMQKFSAIAGALTKSPAPPPVSGNWADTFNYDGHLVEADDTHEVFRENFAEQIEIGQSNTGGYTAEFVGDGSVYEFNQVGDALHTGFTVSQTTTSFEDTNFLVQSTSDMEAMRTIQLGSGRLVLVWFGQGIHELTTKDPASGPFPSIMNAFAEVGILTSNSIPTAPAADADTDGDGVSDLLETASNLNPAVPDRQVLTAGTGTAGLPLVTLDHTAQPQRLRVEYLRHKQAATLGISYEVQWTSDLSSWSSGAHTTQVTSINDQWERVVVTDPAPANRRFGRVSVTRQLSP